MKANNRRQSDRIFSRLISALGKTFGVLFLLAGMAKGVGADTVSFPDNAAGAPGQPAQVFLDVTGGSGFIAVDLDVSFDNTVIVATKVGKGSLATANNCSVEDNIPVPPNPAQSVVAISVFCETAVAGNGQLLRLDFDVVGVVGNASPLNIDLCLIDEGAIPCTPDNGLLTVVAPQRIAGKIIYYNGLDTRPPLAVERPVSAENVRLFGDLTAQVASDATGAYEFSNIVALNPNLMTRPKKRGEFNNAITAFDAALVARHLVGIALLNARQQMAADVTANGALTALDASRIAQFRVGLIDDFKMGDDCGTDFIFVPDPAPVANQTIQQPSTLVVTTPPPTVCVFGEIDYSPLVGDAADQDYIAILMGDVSGNWQPAPPPPASLQIDAERNATQGKGWRLHIGHKAAKPGEIITLPVRIARGKGVMGVDLALQYSPRVLAPLRVEKTTLSRNMTLVTNTDEPGLVRVALYGAEVLRRGGNLLAVTFEVIGREGTQSPVEVVEGLVNEEPAASGHGRVRVR